MNTEQIKNNIEKIIKNTIKRSGIDGLTEFLGNSDFYTAPASSNHHLSIPGGLAAHSLNVYNILAKLNFDTDTLYNNETIAICGLFHDLCKTGFYKLDKGWEKDSLGCWGSYDKYVVDDKLPLGHGEKSVAILQRYIELTYEELMAIRWHMGVFTAGLQTDYALMQAFNKATECPLVPMLFIADYQACKLMERVMAQCS